MCKVHSPTTILSIEQVNVVESTSAHSYTSPDGDVKVPVYSPADSNLIVIVAFCTLLLNGTETSFSPAYAEIGCVVLKTVSNANPNKHFSNTFP